MVKIFDMNLDRQEIQRIRYDYIILKPNRPSKFDLDYEQG